MPYPPFPKGFLFRTATAAFQIRGSPSPDGKDPAILDTFTHTIGGDSADTACAVYRNP